MNKNSNGDKCTESEHGEHNSNGLCGIGAYGGVELLDHDANTFRDVFSHDAVQLYNEEWAATDGGSILPSLKH